MEIENVNTYNKTKSAKSGKLADCLVKSFAFLDI